MERLIIKNFGPIKEVDLILNPLTVFIGDNGTGKSTIAKILAICRYFSYLKSFNLNRTLDSFEGGLYKYDIVEYFKINESEIFYENEDYIVKVFSSNRWVDVEEDTGKHIYDDSLTSELIQKSEKFKNLFTILSKKHNESRANKNNIVIKDLFKLELFPGNNFFQFEVKNVMKNPCFIPIERVLQGISFNKDLLLSEAVQDQLRKLERFAINSGSRVKNLNLLNLEFKREGNINYIKKQGDSEFYSVANAASGFQNVTAIALAVNHYNTLNRKEKTFIIEEPEISLFPKTQKELMEFFVKNINKNNHQFILPTHSPYVLSTLNNCLYAYSVGNKNNQKYKEQTSKIKPESQWLNPNDISVYYLENGTVIDIFDREENLINTDYIDGVSREINKEFDELLTIEMQDEE